VRILLSFAALWLYLLFLLGDRLMPSGPDLYLYRSPCTTYWTRGFGAHVMSQLARALRLAELVEIQSVADSIA